MYFADYHVHSDFSADGKDKLEEIVKEAIRKNLKEIAITEHYDYDLDGTAHYNKDFAVDIEKYEQELRKLQVKYAASIKVLFGLEFAKDGIEQAKIHREEIQRFIDGIKYQLKTCGYPSILTHRSIFGIIKY